MTAAKMSAWKGRFPRNEIISLLDVNRRHNLAESTSRNLRVGELVELLGGFDTVRELELGYGTSAGLPALREAVAADSGVGADNVITTQGTSLGLFLLAFELCRPGDRAALVTPCFPPSRNALIACGVEIDEVSLGFDESYQIDPDRIARCLSPRTRMVSIANPQNPSGVRTPENLMHLVLDVMAKRTPNAFLFVDETYRAATYGDEPVPPSVAAIDPRVIVGSSVSKAYGAPGLRVGWLITRDAALRDQLIVAKLNTVISGSVLDEGLAAGLLTAGQAALSTRRHHLNRALDALARWHGCESHRVDWVCPQGGALCCLRLRRDVFDATAVTRFWAALPPNELQLASGEWFGDVEGGRVFRLGFGFLPELGLEPALAALSVTMDAVLAA